MATGRNHELDTLIKNKSAITDSVSNQSTPRWLSVKLQEKGMISAENASTNPSLSNEDKVNCLIQAVESKLRQGPNPALIFQEFVEILQSEPALEDLAQKLQTGKCTCSMLFSTVASGSACPYARLLMCHVKSMFQSIQHNYRTYTEFVTIHIPSKHLRPWLLRGFVGGAQGKYKKWGPIKWIVCVLGGRGSFEILHALKCVLGAPETLFHTCTQYIYT